MSQRPVPRRESPWGLPDGEHREPKAHRCNDRVEDVIQYIRWMWHMKLDGEVKSVSELEAAAQIYFSPACFEGNPFKTVPGPFKLFWQCMRSKPGEEPTAPFFYLELDPPTREIKLE